MTLMFLTQIEFVVDWLALHLKVGSGIDYFFKLLGLMWTNLMFFIIADNLKVSPLLAYFFLLKIVQILGENWL